MADNIEAGKGIGVPAVAGIAVGLGLLAAALFGGKSEPKTGAVAGPQAPKLRKTGKP